MPLIMISSVFKLSTIFLLLLCILLLSVSKLFIVVSFYANQRNIANNYCINKNNRSLHCDGKCFLMRMLKKEAQREKDVHECFSKTQLMFCHHYFPMPIEKAFASMFLQDYHLQWDAVFHKSDVFNRLLRPPSLLIV